MSTASTASSPELPPHGGGEAHGGMVKSLSLWNYFTMGFGAIIGTGWVLLVGDWMILGGGPAAVSAALTLRGTLGVLGVFSVLALCLVPLLRMAVQYLFYQLAAFFSGMVGSQSLSRFLEQLSSAFSLMLAMTAGGAFLLLVSLLIAMMMVVTV